MSAKKEIERKWLLDVNNIGCDFKNAKKTEMEQMYISFSPTVRIRKEDDSRYILCVKGKPEGGGLSRDEFEIEITADDYARLSGKADGRKICKTRFYVPDGIGHIMEIDIFKGELSGLAYMEIEFASDDEAISYTAPAWVLKDVTNDHRYKNAALARYGFPE